ncbi:MAG: hypothetical protein ACRDN9_17205 [Streptosporangiaceae bacterium]
MMLHVRGVHYDVGHHYDVGQGQGPASTRPHFDRAGVEADMVMIAGQLHANAVRVTGTDLSRVAIAAGLALEAGLTVWFSPHPGDLAGDDIVSYLAEAARMAEELRSAAGSVVMVAGCELSLFCAGYLPGPTLDDRLDSLTGASAVPGLQTSFSELPRALNTTLGQSVAAIRDHFRGPVTYASAPWETVDWARFDLVSADLYRDSSNAAGYRDSLRSYARFGKPVVVSEFGCCTYKGAADAGGAGFMIFDDDTQPPALKLKVTGLQRSEAEQSRYLRELYAIFDEEGIHGAFWHTFAGWTFPHRPGRQADLDLGSFGLVKVIEAPSADKEAFALEPKEAFWALAAAYRQARPALVLRADPRTTQTRGTQVRARPRSRPPRLDRHLERQPPPLRVDQDRRRDPQVPPNILSTFFRRSALGLFNGIVGLYTWMLLWAPGRRRPRCPRRRRRRLGRPGSPPGRPHPRPPGAPRQ